MRKKTIVLLCGAVLLLGACQAKKETETKMSDTKMETTMNDKVLAKGNWEDVLHTRLVKLIEENGKMSKDYKEDKKPYAVFDWDNTTIINDIGEATFTYQISNLAFKMTPEQFDTAVRETLPEDDFKEEFNNKDGQAVNINKIATDLLADYTVLYNEYSGMKGSKSLDEVKKMDEFKDFSAKLRYLYEAVGGTFSSDISYPWVTYMYAGMTSEEVQELTEKSIDYALKDDLVYETWESPSTLKGEAGQVSVTFKLGVRSVQEMQNLYKAMMDNGIDVYICSASYYDVIVPYATNSKYGYNIPKDHVFAMRLVKDEAGVIQSKFDTSYAQTQGEGKTKTIKDLIAVNYDGAEPIMIGGDSNGDYAMLKDFPELQVGLIFNLLRDPSKGVGLLAKEAIDTYEKEDEKYFLQGRDENKGVLLPQRETIKLDKKDAKLMKE
ncbi:haloacid dehalogenase-like hydrolase [Streptococcus cuniculi]|uniref:phosphoserine phosphatase n=1 Tax=Streptococcus cuniculi TaxID=1432788 RepID=A0A4Y9JFN2_9STRE|nr:haloacid dehalogenase-like hydrolase [Streptococcus cuniculi]MBF0777615.1 haloacid dehalogenase-like hydrolase [Streptococcus cuniculi]TFU98655.1 haloacid dehalogenase-like hydrolase [Streptococcus cuniculi]